MMDRYALSRDDLELSIGYHIVGNHLFTFVDSWNGMEKEKMMQSVSWHVSIATWKSWKPHTSVLQCNLHKIH
jgi:hypothetical protein